MHAVLASAGRALKTMEGGARLAEVFLEERRVVHLESGRRGPSRSERRRRGACLRRASRRRTDALHGDDPSAAWLDQAARALATGAGLPDDTDSPLEIPGAAVPRRELETLAGRLADLAEEVATLAADTRVRAVRSRQVVIVARDGAAPRNDRRDALRVEVAVPGVGAAVRWAAAGSTLEDLSSRLDAGVIRDGIARRIRLLRDAGPPPVGRFPAILRPEAAALLVHEALGHPLEADAAGSWLDDPIDGAPCLELIDHPGRVPGAGSYAIDDEGTEGRCVVLMSEGRPTGRLRDRLSADRAGEAPTGHGRRQSYRDLPAPRLACTVLEPGAHDPDALVADVVRGVLVETIASGTVDPISGSLCLLADSARLIEGGRPGQPVRGLVLYGNAREWLETLAGVGNDLRFDGGMAACSKGGQTVPIIVGSPSLAFAAVPVGGVNRP